MLLSLLVSDLGKISILGDVLTHRQTEKNLRLVQRLRYLSLEKTFGSAMQLKANYIRTFYVKSKPDQTCELKFKWIVL